MQLIQETQEHGILRLMLDDNARRNALSMDMLGQLQTALDQAAGEPAVRVIVLAATGPAFSAGHDLKEMTRAREAPDGGKDFFCRNHGDLCAGDANDREPPETSNCRDYRRCHGGWLPVGREL